VRQHVNPLSRFFQQPRPLPTLAELFTHPDQPLHLDIGCARGRFLLALALVEAAEAERQALGLGNLHYLFCNANISLQDWLTGLPAGLLERVSIQFPDPWFKQKHHKRRVLQPALLQALGQALAPGKGLFIQSDVPAVIEPMVQLIEASGGFERPSQDQQPWRMTNPLPVATEREAYVLARGLPVYRVLYQRNTNRLPPLQELENRPHGVDNPA
jgi:tRNA (guanine-N7-)-methyltransferase